MEIIPFSNTIPCFFYFIVSYMSLFTTALDLLKTLAPSQSYSPSNIHPFFRMTSYPGLTFISLTYSFPMTSSTSATHSYGHTLEVVVTWNCSSSDNIFSSPLNIAFNQLLTVITETSNSLILLLSTPSQLLSVLFRLFLMNILWSVTSSFFFPILLPLVPRCSSTVPPWPSIKALIAHVYIFR